MKIVLIFTLLLSLVLGVMAGEKQPKQAGRHLTPEKRQRLLDEVRRHCPERVAEAEQDDDVLECVCAYPGELDERKAREDYLAAHGDELLANGKLEIPTREHYEKVASPALETLMGRKLDRREAGELAFAFQSYWCEPPDKRAHLLSQECNNSNRLLSTLRQNQIDRFVSGKLADWFFNAVPVRRWFEPTPRLLTLFGRNLTSQEVAQVRGAMELEKLLAANAKAVPAGVPPELVKHSKLVGLQMHMPEGTTLAQCEQLLSGDAGDWIVEKSDEEPPGPTIIRR